MKVRSIQVERTSVDEKEEESTSGCDLRDKALHVKMEKAVSRADGGFDA